MSEVIEWRSRSIVFCLVAVLAAAPAAASTYLDIGDDAYAILSRLEADGIIRSGLLTTKPLSRRESVRLLREAEKNSEDDGSAFIKSLVQDLKRRIRPEETAAGTLRLIDSIYGKYMNTDAEVRTLSYGAARQKEQAFNYNNDGDFFSRESNYRAGFTSRIEDLGRFSFYLNPEYRTSEGKSELILKRGYAVFDFGWDLVAGRDSLWWGPGHHGALLLSNNAEPFTMIRINNPEPVTLPWIFKYFGPFQFTFFAANLENDRSDVPDPYLWGMRLNFEPHPVIEIGLTRTAVLGGRGRPDDMETWLKSIGGLREHDADGAGDQRAGYDVKLTLPFRLQPIQIYTEGAAEDTVGWRPVQWAYIYGIYLPRLPFFERLEFRSEWAESYDRHEPSSWYTHHVYTAGYAYNGMIIGHHMGTNARDVFLELAWRFPEKNGRISLSYDVQEHNISLPVREKEHELAVRVGLSISGAADLGLMYGYGWTDNVGNIAGAEQTNHAAGATLTYRF